MQLAGKRIVITGSTSGIGRATAVMAAAEGASVVVSGRRHAEADAAVTEITAAGGTAHAVTGDVADAAELADALATSKNSIYVSRSSARKNLKKAMETMGFFGGPAAGPSSPSSEASS